MNCRHCGKKLTHLFADLHHQPPSNAFLSAEQLNRPEMYYPLRAYVCDECFLVQIDEYKEHEAIFNQDYVYFSSVSSSWLEHSRQYADMMRERFGLSGASFVVETASNDGYLLQYFKQAGIPCLGIEPSSSTAAVARANGVESIEEFFGTALARRLRAEGKTADVLLGNNVLAHVPDINDFVRGMQILLKPGGVITVEFPHLMELVAGNEFDTIYQEHYSYLSFTAVCRIFSSCGLRVFDVERLPTHGGSLRVFAAHAGDLTQTFSPRVTELLETERAAGMTGIPYYSSFRRGIEKTKNALLRFLLAQQAAGKTVAAYGAAAKGNTLLNLCGIKPDLLPFCVDKAASKQGKFMPGSHIPVFAPEKLAETRPDYVLILPWNIKNEVLREQENVLRWGGKFVTAIPDLSIFPG